MRAGRRIGWRAATAVAALTAHAAAAAGREDLLRLLADKNASPLAVAQAAVEAGPQALAALRELAVAGPPAIAPAALRAWETARWSTARGMTADAARPLLGSLGDASVRAAWDAFLATQGAEAMAIVIPLRETPGFQETALRAVPLLLSAVSPAELAAWLARQADGGVRSAAQRLLRESADRAADAAALLRAGEVLLLLWWYADAAAVAERGWTFGRDDAFVALAVSAIRRGGLESLIADAFRRLRDGRADRAAREDELVFWARVAGAVGAADRVRGGLRPADLAGVPPRDAGVVVAEMRRIGLRDEALALLDDARVPWLVYLRAWLRRDAGDPAGAERDLEGVFASLDRGEEMDQSAAFETAELMDRHGEPDLAVRVWTAIVERPPDDTLHDLNARLRLARVAESRRDYAGAVAHCEAALRISQRLGADQPLAGPEGQRGTEWLMRAILDLRRKAAAESAKAWPSPQ